MANELHVKHSGSWVQPKEVHVRHSGSWRNCRQVWIKQSGVWRPVFGVIENISGFTVDDVEASPATATASITFDTTGNIVFVGNGSDTTGLWYSPVQTGIGSSYWIKFSVGSGASWTNTGTITAGTVYALSTARTLEWTRSTTGLTFGIAQARIYSDSGGTNEIAYIGINASVEVT